MDTTTTPPALQENLGHNPAADAVLEPLLQILRAHLTERHRGKELLYQARVLRLGSGEVRGYRCPECDYEIAYL